MKIYQLCYQVVYIDFIYTLFDHVQCREERKSCKIKHAEGYSKCKKKIRISDKKKEIKDVYDVCSVFIRVLS